MKSPFSSGDIRAMGLLALSCASIQLPTILFSSGPARLATGQLVSRGAFAVELCLWTIALLQLRQAWGPLARRVSDTPVLLFSLSVLHLRAASELLLGIVPSLELLRYAAASAELLIPAGVVLGSAGAAALLAHASVYVFLGLRLLGKSVVSADTAQRNPARRAVVSALLLIAFYSMEEAAGLAGGPEGTRAERPGQEALPEFRHTPSFALRGGNPLSRGTNVVIFWIEGCRADWVDLERTVHFRSGNPRRVVVPDFFVPVPHSSNSLYSLFTGRHSTMPARLAFDRIRGPETLSGALRLRGYEAVYITTGPGWFEGLDVLFRNAGVRVVDRRTMESDGRTSGGGRAAFSWGLDDALLVGAVSSALDRRRGPVLFLVHSSNTHAPYFNPRPDRFARFANNTPKGRYRNAIAYSLEQADRIVDEFASRGLKDRTLFVLTSDHGESFGEHGFRGHDFSLFNAEIAVPLVLLHPAFARDRPSISDVGVMLDIFPTIMDLLGNPTGATTHGRSLFRTGYVPFLPLRAWRSDDFRGLIEGASKWIHLRRAGVLLRTDLREESIQEIQPGSRREEVVQRLQRLAFPR